MDIEDADKSEEVMIDMINDKVAKSSRHLQKELDREKNELHKLKLAKNDVRGAQKSNTLSTKKLDKEMKRNHNKAPKVFTQKAAGATNDSSKGNRNNATSQKSKKNNGNSTSNGRSRQKK